MPSNFVPSVCRSRPSTVPDVIIFWLPKLGFIFVPSILASLATFALVITPSLGVPISTDLPIVIIKKSDPLAGAALNITDDPLKAKPSLG